MILLLAGAVAAAPRGKVQYFNQLKEVILEKLHERRVRLDGRGRLVGKARVEDHAVGAGPNPFAERRRFYRGDLTLFVHSTLVVVADISHEALNPRVFHHRPQIGPHFAFRPR